jgi:hypothetical protein
LDVLKPPVPLLSTHLRPLNFVPSRHAHRLLTRIMPKLHPPVCVGGGVGKTTTGEGGGGMVPLVPPEPQSLPLKFLPSGQAQMPLVSTMPPEQVPVVTGAVLSAIVAHAVARPARTPSSVAQFLSSVAVPIEPGIGCSA